jgi:hypothetical protein
VDGGFIEGKLLTIQMLLGDACSDVVFLRPRAKKCGVSNSGLAATPNPVSQVLW